MIKPAFDSNHLTRHRLLQIRADAMITIERNPELTGIFKFLGEVIHQATQSGQFEVHVRQIHIEERMKDVTAHTVWRLLRELGYEVNTSCSSSSINEMWTINWSNVYPK
jgi:recombinational DNA repair protein (RecF pathway)